LYEFLYRLRWCAFLFLYSLGLGLGLGLGRATGGGLFWREQDAPGRKLRETPEWNRNTPIHPFCF
jgi:hypothetical protein